MKKRLLFQLLLYFIPLAGATAREASWTPVDPLHSGTIYASISMKESGDRVSAGGNLIKSVDGGWNWDPKSQGNGFM